MEDVMLIRSLFAMLLIGCASVAQAAKPDPRIKLALELMDVTHMDAMMKNMQDQMRCMFQNQFAAREPLRAPVRPPKQPSTKQPAHRCRSAAHERCAGLARIDVTHSPIDDKSWPQPSKSKSPTSATTPTCRSSKCWSRSATPSPR